LKKVEDGKEFEFGVEEGKKFFWTKKGNTLFRNTEPWNSKFKSGSGGKVFTKKKIRTVMPLLIDMDGGVEDVNNALSSDWDLFSVAPMGDGKRMVFTLFKT
jgi:hypothetical protein